MISLESVDEPTEQVVEAEAAPDIAPDIARVADTAKQIRTRTIRTTMYKTHLLSLSNGRARTTPK